MAISETSKSFVKFVKDSLKVEFYLTDSGDAASVLQINAKVNNRTASADTYEGFEVVTHVLNHAVELLRQAGYKVEKVSSMQNGSDGDYFPSSYNYRQVKLHISSKDVLSPDLLENLKAIVEKGQAEQAASTILKMLESLSPEQSAAVLARIQEQAEKAKSPAP